MTPMIPAWARTILRTWRRVMATTRKRANSRVCSSTFIVSVLATPKAATSRASTKIPHRPPTTLLTIVLMKRDNSAFDCSIKPFRSQSLSN